MDASILICTRNRADSLTRALASIEAARHPEGFSWEVVVVDNGSADRTPDVLADFATRLPLTRGHEPQPGLSRARNTAAGLACGRYLIWTDDDVVVEPDWLTAYAEAFRRWPDAAIFGGKILPVLEEPITPWFAACLDDLALLCARRDFGDEPLPLTSKDDRVPFGANFVIRAAEQARFPFDPELGVAPGRSRGGEETTVLHAMLAEGHTGYYVPRAVVRHMIPPRRQTIASVRSYYRGHGDGPGLADTRAYGRNVAGRPLWLWRQIAEETAAYAWGRIFSRPDVWIPHLKRLAYMEGYGDGLNRGNTRGSAR